ncbi:MAG: hypothetical protein MUF51_03775, partial [Vicinamibacteria bacterium]|nr:hypothetical protein [Vicinamibacteria bacterium]
MRLLRCALATFVLLVSATPILAQAGLRLIKSTEPIAFDGRLDEPVWKSAPSISAFYQREPLAGEVATENTEVRIVYHKQALYVGILCFDRHPELIVAKEMKRDGDVDEDDHVAIVLDTYSDRRNAFYI